MILHLVPPAELHLLLGVVNKLYDEVEKFWSDISEWAKGCKAYKCCRQGSGFNGNSCMKLIDPANLNELQKIIPQEYDMFVSALRAFGRVVKSCFGMALSPSYAADIQHFRKCYLNLGISVTPKVMFVLVLN